MVELNFSSNLKKFLFTLRKKNVINENRFVQSLDEIKIPSKNVPNQLVPLIDMFGLLYIEREIEDLDQTLFTIETDIKNAIQAWEIGALSKEEAKVLLTELVSKKKESTSKRDKLQSRIQTKISRLDSLKEKFHFDFEEFITFLLQTSETAKISDLTTEFNKIWARYSIGLVTEDKPMQEPPILNDVEVDILKFLMVPIAENDDPVFDLDDVIQPIVVDSQSSLLRTDDVSETPSDIEHGRPDAVLEQKMSSPWSLVGSMAYDPSKKPIGLFRPPIRVDDSIYLPIVREEPLSLSLLKRSYGDILTQANLDLNVTTTQQIQAEIAQTIGVPEEFALQPSFFNHWITVFGVEVVPAKPRLTKVKFAKLSSIDESSGLITLKEEGLKEIRVAAWIPARGERVSDSKHIGQKIIGMAGSNFGKIIGIMDETPFGQSLVIKRKVPPSYLLDLVLEGLGARNLVELRVSIAKKLNIDEGEVFSAENLWNINFQERLLISPHEIICSYFTVLPAAAFTYSDIIRGKIGVYFHSIPETFRYLVGKQVISDQEEKGLIYGFSILHGTLNILWSSKSPVEMIREVGRKTSAQYVSRFQKRVAMALGVPNEESYWPSNLARYFMNFIWLEEEQGLIEAISVIEERFSLQKVLFSDIEDISKDGLKCKKLSG